MNSLYICENRRSSFILFGSAAKSTVWRDDQLQGRIRKVWVLLFFYRRLIIVAKVAFTNLKTEAKD